MSPSQAIIFFVSLAFLAILIWILSLISNAVSNDDPDDETDADNQRGPAQNLQSQTQQQSLIAIKDEINAYRRHRQSEENRRAKREKITVAFIGATTIIALVAAAAAIISAVIFGGQLVEMRAEQRPWITVQSIKFIGFKIENDRPTFILQYVLKNVGHTAAFVSAESAIIIGEDSLRWPDRQQDVCKGLEYPKTWAVIPNDLFPYTGNPPKSYGETLSDLRKHNGTYTPMIVGCIKYRSFFEVEATGQTAFYAKIYVVSPGINPADDTSFNDSTGTFDVAGIPQGKVVKVGAVFTGGEGAY